MINFLFFDWYACGIECNPDKIMASLSESYPLGTWEASKPMRGYLNAASLMSPDARPYCVLWWGGGSQGTMVHAFATGSMAHTFASVVRLHYPVHRLSRADVAVDFDEPAAWPSLVSLAEYLFDNKFVRRRPFYHGAMGCESLDTSSGDGRTVEVGSRQSVHFGRFYEKGKKDDKTRPNWCRAEIEFKPRGDARWAYASASPAEMLAATPLGAEVLRVLLGEFAVRPCPAGAVREASDLDKSAAALVKQWSPFIRKLLEEKFHGDINACMAYLLAA